MNPLSRAKIRRPKRREGLEIERIGTGVLQNRRTVLAFDNIIFEGVGGPHRQGDKFAGIRIKSAAVRCPCGLLFPHQVPPLNIVRAAVIEANIEKLIGPGGGDGDPPLFHFDAAVGALRRFLRCHRVCSLCIKSTRQANALSAFGLGSFFCHYLHPL